MFDADDGLFIPKSIDASATIKSGPCKLMVFSPSFGATADTVAIYDNTSATGSPVWQGTFQAATGLKETKTIMCGFNLTTGLHVTFTGGANQIDFFNCTIQ